VVIGEIVYSHGDVAKWLPDSYRGSTPRFTYDYSRLHGPGDERPALRFKSDGGVFVMRVKRGRPVYLDSMLVGGHSWVRGRSMTSLPIHLKLRPVDDACVYVGTVVILLPGDRGGQVPWWTAFGGGWHSTGDRIETTIADTYDRDRANLIRWVEGCELRKTLAVPASAEEIEDLRERVEAARAAQEEQRPRGPEAAAPSGPHALTLQKAW
jgi:hypothetical protein